MILVIKKRNVGAMLDRISPRFSNRMPQQTTKNSIKVIDDLLCDNIYNFNYDTFSFMFELLNAKKPLERAFGELAINSIDLMDKYNGSNCAGLAQKLSIRLKDEYNTDSILVPSFGEITPPPTRNRRYIINPRS